MRPVPHRPNTDAFTLFEVLTVVLIMSILANMIFVCYVRVERANDRGIKGLERALETDAVLQHLRRTIRNARAIVPRHGEWTSNANALILRTATDRIAVFTRRDGRLAEIRPAGAGGRVILHSLYASEIRFDYDGRRPAEAGFVTASFVLDPVWPDTADRMVIRTGAALRRSPQEANP